MPAEDNPIVAARRKRLRGWIADKFDSSRKAFLEDVASRGKFLDPTEISNLQSGKRSFGENKAREIELAASMPEGYLVSPLANSTHANLAASESATEAPLPALLTRAHRILAARGPYSLDDERDAYAFSQAYVAAAVEHLNAFQRMEVDRSAAQAMQQELRKQAGEDLSNKPADAERRGKVSTRRT
ncbi:hypothetical protein [Xanthomonas sp. MUS 060]|uniref:hypothetical protein n=1 Tax=Xanthomonas sp. MUS 060 TaxID=1588031 RepID=UPI0006978853|nr:hypothetical protein [Xanthomonas sp. MUS 060]